MKCTKCGSKVSPNQEFCSKCGAPIEKTNNMYQDYDNKGGVPVWAFIVSLLVVVIIMLVIMFVVMNNSKNNNIVENENTANEVIENSVGNSTGNSAGNSVSNTSGNSTVTQTSKSFYKTKIGSYNVKVPDNLIYYTKDEYLSVGDEEGTWLGTMTIIEGSYNSLNKDTVASKLRQSGVTVGNYDNKTINGLQAITFEVTYSGANMIFAYVRINSMTVGFIEVYCEDLVTYNYDALESCVTILSTAEQAEETTNTNTMNLEINSLDPKTFIEE